MATVTELENKISTIQQDIKNVEFNINQAQAELRNFENEIQRSIARGDNELANSQTTTYNRLTQEQTNRIAYRDRLQSDLTTTTQELQQQQQANAVAAQKDDTGNQATSKPDPTAQKSTGNNQQSDDQGKNIVRKSGGTQTYLTKLGSDNQNFGYERQPKPIQVDVAGGAGYEETPKPVGYQPQVDVPNKRRYNPLSKFSSVTHKISLYAITPDAFNSFVVQGKWNTADLELLVQSGGVTEGIDSPRNQYFNLDFYIDNVEIITKTNAKETRFASNVSNIRFQILEPFAMTFPSRLVAAQKDIQKKANIRKPINSQPAAMNCPYLLVVRFYGYDVNGELVTKDPRESPSVDYKTDVDAVYERAFPIIISKFSFKLEHKTTTYDLEAKLINEQFSFGMKRGLVKSGKSILGDTVESAIGGTTTSTNGLLDKLNEEQKALVSNGNQSVADVYKVVYETGSGIADALIVDKDFYTKQMTGNEVTKADSVNVRTANRDTQTVQKNQRTVQIGSGTAILAAIDQIISQSTFLRDKIKAFDIDENQQAQTADKSYQTVGSQQAFEWYNVRPQIKFLPFDDKRNDYAIEVTYVIQSYKTPYIRSLAVKNKTKYYGPHKVYKYWYTGQNSEVLSYDMNYNLLYFNTQALSSKISLTEGDNAPNVVMPASDASPAGKTSMRNEIQNTVRTFLYSPADQLKANIKILGDPDFLMPVESASLNQMLSKWYGPDGYSINANSGETFIEIGFNEVIDYDNQVGLMEPKNNITFWPYPDYLQEMTEGRMIYMVVQVTSKFSKGTFTQDLKSIIPNFLTVENNTSDTNRGTPNATANTGRNRATDNPESNRDSTGELNQNAPPEECLPLDVTQVNAIDGGMNNPGQVSIVDEFITVNDDSMRL